MEDHKTIQEVILNILGSVESYYIIFLVVIGLLGNSISIGLFLFTKLNHKHSNFILSALALSDNGYLITLFLFHVKLFNIDLFNKFNIICKSIVYLNYVFSFLSVWYVILFSIERFIVVQFPLKKFVICNQTRNKLSIIFLFIFSMSFYSIVLVASGVEVREELYECTTKKKWIELIKLMSIIDVFVTILIPFIIILFTNISIYVKLMNTLKLNNQFIDKQDLQKTEEYSSDDSYPLKKEIKFNIDNSDVAKSQNQNQILINDNRRKTVSFPRDYLICSHSQEIKKINSNPELSSFNGSKIDVNHVKPNLNENSTIKKCKKSNFAFIRKFSKFTSLLRRSAELKRAKMYSKTTRMLIIISITFVLLNSLMAYSRIRTAFSGYSASSSSSSSTSSTLTLTELNFLNSSSNNNNTISNASGTFTRNYNAQLIDQLACYFYYLNFSLNFFLYVLNGSQFRDILFKITKKLQFYKHS